jgi:hypothetical protein
LKPIEEMDINKAIEETASNLTNNIISDKPEINEYCRPEKVSDLMKEELPEINWIVKDLISEGYTILAGRSKGGKSWLVLNLALAVSNGGMFLGTFPTSQRSVWYISLEDSKKRLQSRIKRILSNEPVELQAVPENFYYSLDVPKLDNGGSDYIDSFLEAHSDIRLIIIDTLKRISLRTKKQNEFDSDYDSGSLLQNLAKKHNATLISVLHTRKTPAEDNIFDMISGTVGTVAAADTLMLLNRGSNLTRLHVTGRDIDSQELSLKFDSGLWQYIGDTETLTANQLNVRWEKYFIDSQIRSNELIEMIAKEFNVSRSTGFLWINKAISEGILKKVKRGFLELF